jgi:uncharacterized membrane protein YbhN (UPF0104 family)
VPACWPGARSTPLSTDGAVTAGSSPPAEGSRGRLGRLLRIGLCLAGIALALWVLDLLGVPVGDWIHKLIKNVRAVPTGAIVAGAALETLQTVFAAISWVTILRAAFPDAGIAARPVIASYAVAVALNGFLPANIGTLVMMVMFTSLIAGATFAAVFSGFVIQKIPFTVLSIAMYVYLFATVSGSLSVDFKFASDHPGAAVAIVVGAIVLIVLLAMFFWHRSTLRDRIKTGGAILGQPKRFMIGVALPEVASFVARLGIVAVFLAAYSIPVTFHSVVAVTGANSISSSVSVTPGGAGVTQALNVVVLDSLTTKENATAYSVAQQLIITAWDVVFAVILVVWVFGWSGGKDLVKRSYVAAEEKREELKRKKQEKQAEPTAVE